ncbi:MAG: hypothetical protein ABJJ44_14160 [Paraglaciecola sp.]|uniref:hypothetical protein n=1 Tax=Paraglaciecola sp. TaxID=1920173 RepID=UPI0032993EBD
MNKRVTPSFLFLVVLIKTLIRTKHMLGWMFLLSFTKTYAFEIEGVVQFNYVKSDELPAWFEQDTGILAYSESSVNLQQGLVKVSDSFTNGLSYSLVGNVYQLGSQNIGVSQAQVAFKPLSKDKIRWRARAGFFYPKMSLENVDTGWLSPFTYTQSAINSWVGEELRTAGLELTLYSPGRSRNSAFSWELHGSVYKGNDTLGTVISWRGFAMHDRQSLNNDKVPFAAYPSVVQEDRIFHPDYVEPFHELDGRFGFYLGAHLDYYRQSSFRYYYYDNQADPNVVNYERLYAWRTKFHSIALQHKFNKNTRLITQWMTGSSIMGKHFVYIDFDAWYLMLSHKYKSHRFSARFDLFEVNEDDIFPWDPNNSDGEALTLAWRYDLNMHWQVGLEQHFNQNSADIRATLGQNVSIDQQQSLAVLQYRW